MEGLPELDTGLDDIVYLSDVNTEEKLCNLLDFSKEVYLPVEGNLGSNRVVNNSCGIDDYFTLITLKDQLVVDIVYDRESSELAFNVPSGRFLLNTDDVAVDGFEVLKVPG
ncbi:MAG: hypothetical protein U9Q67_04805, partial [Patescibacteria group bacterium]|nr:hypothetical protein [Patescibacteria group bacterium]